VPQGTGADLEVIRAWWSLRSLRAVRWLAEHGFDPRALAGRASQLMKFLDCVNPYAPRAQELQSGC
jgi:hypothetical protein